jgi:hypothetical protein
MINGEQVTQLIKGSGSLGMIEVVNQMPTGEYVDIIKILMQVLVGIGTLYHMWKSRNNKPL